MNKGTMFYRVITRKLQQSGKAFQFILLAGFESKLTQATCTYLETLNPNSTLTRDSIDALVERLQKLSSSGDVCDVTDGGTSKKLNKLFDVQAV